MRQLKAELVFTPTAEKLYKVVVTRGEVVISEQPVASKTAGQAMIAEIETMGRQGRFEL